MPACNLRFIPQALQKRGVIIRLCIQYQLHLMQYYSAERITGRANIAAKVKASSEEKPSRPLHLELPEGVDLSKVVYGANYFKEGEDPKIMEDSEYPDWLWTALDPIPVDLNDKRYRRKLRREKLRRNNETRIYEERWPGWKKFYNSK